jgi:hypothetical protein
VQTPLSQVCPDAQHVPPHSTFGQLLESCDDEPPSEPVVVSHVMSTHDCPSLQSAFVVQVPENVGEPLPPPLHAVATRTPANGASRNHGKLDWGRWVTFDLLFLVSTSTGRRRVRAARAETRAAAANGSLDFGRATNRSPRIGVDRRSIAV